MSTCEIITEKSINDKDFIDIIEKDGSPSGWEMDWFREFINEHSDFYTKYPMDDETLTDVIDESL